MDNKERRNTAGRGATVVEIAIQLQNNPVALMASVASMQVMLAIETRIRQLQIGERSPQQSAELIKLMNWREKLGFLGSDVDELMKTVLANCDEEYIGELAQVRAKGREAMKQEHKCGGHG